MTEVHDPTTDAAVELLSFRLAEQEYSVDIMQVREIRSWTQATTLPHAPTYVRGVINLRGTVLPVIDLAVRLGLPARTVEGRTVIIVVHLGGQTVGLVVDAVSDILAFARDDLQPPPEVTAGAQPMFISALTILNGRMIRVLDLAAILPQHKVSAA